jgi:hypothetical protein
MGVSISSGYGEKSRVEGLRPFLFSCVGAAIILTGCGAVSKTTTTNNNPPPSQPQPQPQPNYPTVPPVAITWSPSSSPLPAPAAVPPQGTDWANGASDFPLTVSSPTNNSSVTSPLNVVASATPKNPIFFMRVFVDQNAEYFTFDNSINTQIFLAPGQHTITVYAEDNQGYISATPVNVNVTSQQQQTLVSSIQDMAGWQSCGGLFPRGSGRAGQICAAGGGTPTSTMTQNQTSPAMDAKSAKFSIGPAQPACPHYCNMLYFNPFAGGDNVSHFTYDLYFYIDNPNAPQALEFDMNQTFGGNRWVWGSECNFKADGKWDIWNDAPNTGWEATYIPCTPFPANTWIHLVWQVERVGNQVHYISLTVGDQVYQVDTYYPYQQQWTLEEIDNAFQMDLDALGTPYNVWLDQVNVTAY